MSASPRGALCSGFQSHSITAAAGAAALHFALEQDLCARARATGARVAPCREATCEIPISSELRGVGAMFGLATRPIDGGGPKRWREACAPKKLDDGLVTWECGRNGKVAVLIAPGIATDAVVVEACKALLRPLHGQSGRRRGTGS